MGTGGGGNGEVDGWENVTGIGSVPVAETMIGIGPGVGMDRDERPGWVEFDPENFCKVRAWFFWIALRQSVRRPSTSGSIAEETRKAR